MWTLFNVAHSDEKALKEGCGDETLSFRDFANGNSLETCEIFMRISIAGKESWLSIFRMNAIRRLVVLVAIFKFSQFIPTLH